MTLDKAQNYEIPTAAGNYVGSGVGESAKRRKKVKQVVTLNGSHKVSHLGW